MADKQIPSSQTHIHTQNLKATIKGDLFEDSDSEKEQSPVASVKPAATSWKAAEEEFKGDEFERI